MDCGAVSELSGEAFGKGGKEGKGLEHSGINHLSVRKLIWQWSKVAVEQVDELDEDNDQVIDLVQHMVTEKPDKKSSADQCLQRRMLEWPLQRTEIISLPPST